MSSSQDIVSPSSREGKEPGGSQHSFGMAMTIAVIASSLGDTFLKKGMLELHIYVSPSVAGILHGIAVFASDVWLDLGIILMVIHFVAFVRALKMGPLSAVVPLRSSTYIFTTLLARYFLHEDVNVERWAAILLILLGVSIVGFSAGKEKSLDEHFEPAGAPETAYYPERNGKREGNSR